MKLMQKKLLLGNVKSFKTLGSESNNKVDRIINSTKEEKIEKVNCTNQ